MKTSNFITATALILISAALSSCNMLPALSQLQQATAAAQPNGMMPMPQNMNPQQMAAYMNMMRQNPQMAASFENGNMPANVADYMQYSSNVQGGNADWPMGLSYYNGGDNAMQNDYIERSYDNQQSTYDAAFEKWSDNTLGYQNYNTEDGGTVKLYSGYDNTYYNNTTGEYLQTNDGVDPNTYSTSSWSSMSASDYSPISYSSYSSSSEE